MGRDFRYGARGAGDVDLLIELGATFGFTVEVVDDVRPRASGASRPTWIRELLAEGDVRHATALLGHTPTVLGHRRARREARARARVPDREPHARVRGPDPRRRRYAGWLTDGARATPRRSRSATTPRSRACRKKQVEAYVLDRELDLYDHVVDVEFVERLRGMVAFTEHPRPRRDHPRRRRPGARAPGRRLGGIVRRRVAECARGPGAWRPSRRGSGCVLGGGAHECRSVRLMVHAASVERRLWPR